MLKRRMALVVRLLGNQRGEVTVETPPVETPPVETSHETPPEPEVVPVAALTAERKKRQDRDREAREAREEAAYWRGIAEAGGKVPPVATTPPPTAAPTAPVAPVKPKRLNPADYEEWSDYEAAQEKLDDEYQEKRDAYLVEKTKWDLKTEQHRETVQQTVQQKRKTYADRLEKAAELDPDIMDIANNWHLPGQYQLPLNPTMQDTILESEVGPEMLRHLFNNKQDTIRIAQLGPVAAVRELVKIEATITAQSQTNVKKTSTAPPPVAPSSQQRGAVDSDDDKRPAADVIREMREASFRRR